MATSTTLRVRPHTRDRLTRLAREDDISTPELLDRLVEREEHERLLRAMNDGFERLRSDDAAWAEFRSETTMWDATSTDA